MKTKFEEFKELVESTPAVLDRVRDYVATNPDPEKLREIRTELAALEELFNEIYGKLGQKDEEEI